VKSNLTNDTETFNVKTKYEHEKEFSEPLSQYLNGKAIKPKYDDEQLSIVSTKHDKQRSEDNQRPDIILEQQGTTLDLRWRELSKKFYIECKLSNKLIQGNLNQLVRYKYCEGSDRHNDLHKYGDFHTAITCPEFLREEFRPRDHTQKYLNNFQLIRTLWALGFGVILRKNRRYYIQFNEQEKIRVGTVRELV